ncbi:hypothetical protein [Humibacillus sp. DSM 29435]|uniref:hypothetical protein n=1 Tax=Humibacillus sp. DSM 29435 TaxID=1869167 RepID=UPI000A40FF16|nr:hypothetical protein [Humibacillus sp. DSM 29435]
MSPAGGEGDHDPTSGDAHDGSVQDQPVGADRAVDLTPTTGTEGVAGGDEAHQGFDPLRLCIFATIALLAWLAGPWALAFFAGLGFVGYWRARRAGLLRSRCLLGDTRIVLVYLAVLFLVAAWGIWSRLSA